MSRKLLLQSVVAIGLLALVLIFLGVNFVPRIFASSSAKLNSVDSALQARPNYIDELYPRAIASQLSLARSDWIERHPSGYLINSDWIERHPSVYLTNSDWFERHPGQPK